MTNAPNGLPITGGPELEELAELTEQLGDPWNACWALWGADPDAHPPGPVPVALPLIEHNVAPVVTTAPTAAAGIVISEAHPPAEEGR